MKQLALDLIDLMEDLTPGYSVKKVSDKEYTVSKPGTDYTCKKVGDKWKCNCESGKWRPGKPCKHINMLPPEATAPPKRHDRHLIDKMMPEMHKLFDHIGKWEVVGSYRRKVADFKDIDVLITCTPGEFSKALVALSKDDSFVKTMAGPDIIRGKYQGFDFDLTRVNKDEYGSYLMYRTGSKDFNIRMRGMVKAKGWKLNEHGLYDDSNVKIAGETEESIFKALGMDYISPEHRNR